MVRVLVIDDNQDVRDLIQFILEGAGYSVELAPDGEAGLRSQRARPADVVITDIFMPNQDGLETIARLREEYPRVRVVAMSGGGASELKGGRYLSTAREVGAHVLLPKPFDLDQLLRAIDNVSH
jgi:CheY-like chemotaxis protein